MALFVRRVFEIDDGRTVTLRILQPVQRGKSYRCECEIDWPDRSDRVYSDGCDPLHALLLASERANHELLADVDGQACRFKWQDHSMTGLPAPGTFGPSEPDPYEDMPARYPDGSPIFAGDQVRYNDQSATVVFCVENGEFADSHPRAKWSYLGTGIGLIAGSHFSIEDHPDALTFIARADTLG